MSNSILIVDDEESVRTVLDLHLKDLGYETNGSTKLSETYSLLKKTEFELCWFCFKPIRVFRSNW